MAEKIITRTEMKGILDMYPDMASKDRAVKSFISKGYIIEGLNDKKKATKPSAQAPQEKKEDNLLQSIARPFASTAVTGLAAAQDAFNLMRGNKEAISRTKVGYNVPGLGQVMPQKIGEDITETGGGGYFGTNTLKTIGTGLEVGSWFAPGTGALAKTAVTQPLSIAGKQAAKKLALSRFTQGAAQAGGSELQKSGEITRALPSALFGGGFNVLAGKGLDKLGSKYAERAAIKAADRVAGKVSEKAGKTFSSRIMNSIVKPGKKQLTFGKDPGSAAVKYKIVGDLDQMLSQTEPILSEQVGKIMEVARSPKYSKVKIDGSGWEKVFDNRMKEAAEKGDEALFNKLKQTKEKIKNDFAYEDGEMVMKGLRKTSDIGLEDTINLKRKIGSMRKWDQADPDANEVNKAIHDVYSFFDDRIDEAAPELKGINEDVSNLIGLKDSIKNRINVLERQNILSLGDKFVGGLGALGTAASTGGVSIPAALAGVGSAYASKTLRSPQVMSRIAIGLSKAPSVNRDQLVADILKALASPKGTGTATKGLINYQNSDEQKNQARLLTKGLQQRSAMAYAKSRGESYADYDPEAEKAFTGFLGGIAGTSGGVTGGAKKILGKSIGSLGKSFTKKLLGDAKKFDNVDDFIKSQTAKDYRSAHQIDTVGSSPITEIDNNKLNEFVQDFKNQYGYPSLKSKDLNKLKSIIDNPNKEVTIYRASPKNEINAGDWVTIDKTYANDIKRQNGGKVFSYQVKASDLYYPNTLSGFKELPSLNKWGAFKYQPSELMEKLTNIWNKAHNKLKK